MYAYFGKLERDGNMFRSTTRHVRFVMMCLGLVCLVFLSGCSSPEQKAQSHYESGQELLASKEFAKARLEFLNAINLNEKLTDAWLGLAKIADHNQEFAVSASYLEKALELDPEQVEARLKLARIQLASNDFQRAFDNASKVETLKPDDSDVMALRSTILLRLNDREGARATAERALALNPDNPEAHAVLAADRLAEGDSKGALLFIDRGLATDPDNLGLVLFRMGIFEKAGDLSEVEAMMRKLVEISPKSKQFRKALVGLLTSLERDAEAETEMRALIALDPADTATALDLVKLVQTMKGDSAARATLEGLIKDNPQYIDYKLSLALFDAANSDNDAALATLQKIAAEDKVAENVHKAKVMMASIMLKTDQMDRAAKLVEQVLEVDSKNVGGLELRANLKLRDDDIDGAIVDLREALGQQPKSVDLLRGMARALELKGPDSINLAQENFSQAVRAVDYEPAISIEFADFLVRHGKIKQAESVLANAVTKRPGNVQLLTVLGRVRLRMQDWVGAQAAVQALEKVAASSSASQQILGSALFGQRKFSESISAFQRSYEAASQAAPPMIPLITAYVESGKVDDAEKFLESVLAANPNNADALVLSGSISNYQQKPEQAEASYRLAIDRQPDNAVGHRALAQLYIRQGKVDEARSVLLDARKQLPNDFSLGMLLAAVQQAQGNEEDTISIYEELLKLYPKSPAVLNNLAGLLSENRTDPESIARAAKLATELEKFSVPVFKDTLGWIAFRQGNFDLAAKHLEDAARQLPQLAIVHYHLGMVYVAVDRKDEARALFAKAGDLAANDTSLKARINEANSKL